MKNDNISRNGVAAVLAICLLATGYGTYRHVMSGIEPEEPPAAACEDASDAEQDESGQEDAGIDDPAEALPQDVEAPADSEAVQLDSPSASDAVEQATYAAPAYVEEPAEEYD